MITKKSLIEKIQAMYSFERLYQGYKCIVIHQTTRTFSSEEEKFVDGEWEKLLTQGKVKYSNAIAAINPETIYVNEDELHVDAYPRDFKHYRTTLNSNIAKVWLTGPSGVMKADSYGKNWYVFGVRKSVTLRTGGDIETIPGGFLDVEYLSESNPFQSALYNELEEETGISRESVTSLIPMRMGTLGIDIRGNRPAYNVCTDFLMNISLKPEEIQQSFSSKEREHTKIEIVPEKDLLNYIDKNKEGMNTRTLFTLDYLLQIM